MITVLYVRDDSPYKEDPRVDAWDKTRDARKYTGPNKIIAHPPCRAWGRLSHMANPEPGEKELGIDAMASIWTNGGILEHPKGSRLFQYCGVPTDGSLDPYGGYVLEIDQWDFGHVARKATYLYINGVPRASLPPLPEVREGTPKRSIGGNVKGTTRCTQYQREYTPEALRNWMIEALTVGEDNNE